MQNERDRVAYEQNEYRLAEAVMRRKIRNGQYARADAVTDNYARGLHEGKFGFTFYIRHLPDLRQ